MKIFQRIMSKVELVEALVVARFEAIESEIDAFLLKHAAKTDADDKTNTTADEVTSTASDTAATSTVDANASDTDANSTVEDNKTNTTTEAAA